MTHRIIATLLLAAATVCRAISAPAAATPAIEQRVDTMLAKLSLEEKIDLIGGTDYMFIRGIPSLKLPALKMSDGPMGIGTWGASSAYASGVALAAAWDPDLARRTGVAIGKDARARGVHFLLGPGVNLQRSPLNGRNFEYFGEDPYLAARTTVTYIEGVQSQGVVATVKHFAGNNSELERKSVSSDIDERTLRELYLPAFEAAAREAHVGAVMNAYNRINGVFATESQPLNRNILKEEWGFDGILMSDWIGTHDGVAAANGGLDLEMPNAISMTRECLLPALQKGTVTLATIDDKVRRILRTAVRFGFFERAQLDPAAPLYSQESRAVALEGARASMTLLKNQGPILPLDPNRVKVLAVIGPNAWPAVPMGGGAAKVETFASKSFLTGIADFLGPKTRVLYAAGLPPPKELMRRTHFDPENGQPGLTVQFFSNPNFAGTPVSTKYVASVDQYRSEMWGASARKKTSVRYTGHFTPQKTGAYLVLAGAGSRDSYKLYLEDRAVLTQPSREGQALASTVVQLEAGHTITVRFDYVQDADNIRGGFGLVLLDEVVSAETKEIAGKADAVLVCAGFGPQSESEGYDRSFGLPWGQEILIKAIAAANPRTVVSITSGGGVDMRSWLNDVPAVLATWYAGQEGGTALAELLFGQLSPEGHLPVTFDRTLEENPVHEHYEPVIDPNTKVPHVTYAEGVFLGYRHYTSAGKTPLFPFGFGLSYTTFEFTHMESPATASSATGVDVSFRIKNTGSRAGAEVVQLYIGNPSAQLPRPAKELKGFEKIHLQPGEEKRVTLHLDRRAFAYWDVSTHAWRVDPGKFILYVGDSSENTPLIKTITVEP